MHHERWSEVKCWVGRAQPSVGVLGGKDRVLVRTPGGFVAEFSPENAEQFRDALDVALEHVRQLSHVSEAEGADAGCR